MAIKKENTTPFDSDAQRFILAAGIILMREKRAINYLVQGLKANNLWAKMAAIYPMVGGNLWSCKFNLKNPINSDLAFRLSFVANPTISNQGVDWNGTTQYADTKLNPSTSGTIFTLNDAHISYYSRENTATSAYEFGAVTTVPSTSYIVLNAKGFYAINMVAPASFSNTNSSGFFIVSRTSSILTTQYRNGASVSTSATVSAILPSLNIVIGARNVNGTPGIFDDRQCAFASIGSGLSSTDSFNFYNIVQQFQIILNRAV